MNEDRAARYHRLTRRAGGLSVAASAVTLAALAGTGGAAALRDAAVALTGAAAGSAAVVALVVCALALLHEVVAFPPALYRSFLLERRFGLSSEPFRTWLGDHVRAAAVALLLAVGGAEIVYAAMRVWPRAWWAVAAVALTVSTAVLARVAPVLLLPIFYTFRPLDRPALRERLETLSARAGVPVLGVYEWRLGDRTRRANAALVGLGGTRRILVSDTLLADYSDDEVEVILAHELAHHVHGDVAKGLVVEFGVLLAALGTAAAALRVWAARGGAGAGDAAALPALVLVAGGVMLAARPLLNAWSRRNEHRADRFAVRLTGAAAPFVSAMRKLGAQNLAEERPSRLALWLFHTHPPVGERIARAGAPRP